MIKRIHISNEPSLLLSQKYEQKDKHIWKPNGLWYAIDSEWIDWCEGNMPEWLKKYQYELKIDTSKILTISTKLQFKEFCEEYEEVSEYGEKVNWKKVIYSYSGIEFLNYYSIKYNDYRDIRHMWFWGWDVSGGCIWDLSIIKNIYQK